MKYTKRLLSLILVLALCLTMAACSSAEEKEAAALWITEKAAFDEADALLAAGDYEGAIAAFSSIDRYEEITDKIIEAEKLRMEAERLSSIANAEGLFGNWINISKEQMSEITLSLNPDGTSLVSWGTETYNSTFVCKDSIISLNAPYMNLKITEHDGVTHLVDEEFAMDFVSEENYSAFALQEFEITLDNWQDYFEMKEVNAISVNAFGEVASVNPSVGIFLKEEYYSRLPDNCWDIEISFELSYDETAYKVLDCHPDEFDYNFMGQYAVEPVTPPSWWEMQTGCTTIGQVSDRRNADWVAKESPYYNTFSAEIGMYGGGASDGRTQYVARWTNIQVNRVIGTLKLYPA